MKRRELIAIGIMCGTSKDGIDVMVGKTDGISPLKSIAAISLSYPLTFQTALRAAEYALKETNGNMELATKDYSNYLYEYANNVSNNKKADEVIKDVKAYLKLSKDEKITIEHLTAKYTFLCVSLLKQLLEKAKLHPGEVDVIGDHGIALYHNPKENVTIQIADGQKLANDMGIFVVNDFRANDVRNGGQGAPLAPIYHKALMNSINELADGWVIVNLGGTANITLQQKGKLIGFDTGPANVLLDLFVRTYTRGEHLYDVDGKNALAGKVKAELLEHLKKSAIDIGGDNYLEKLPPKSLDISNYRLTDEVKNYSFEDVCATLAAFTACCVIEGIKLTGVLPIKNIIACGGGAKNPALLFYLKHYVGKEINDEIQILKAGEVGLDSDYLEAELFAFLAVKTIYKEPISFMTTTGCNHDSLGGHGYIPGNSNISQYLNELIKENPKLLNGYLEL